MDHKGEKILLGIIIAISAGVGSYLLAFGVGDGNYSRANNTASAAAPSFGRPIPDGALSPEADAVSRAMIGVWRSEEDEKFTREFREDGTVTDRYEGDTSATTKGIWGAFTADMAPEWTSGLAEGVVYIQMTFGDTSLYFAVVKAADTLELVYLDRGNQLNFTRDQ